MAYLLHSILSLFLRLKDPSQSYKFYLGKLFNQKDQLYRNVFLFIQGKPSAPLLVEVLQVPTPKLSNLQSILRAQVLIYICGFILARVLRIEINYLVTRAKEHEQISKSLSTMPPRLPQPSGWDCWQSLEPLTRYQNMTWLLCCEHSEIEKD